MLTQLWDFLLHRASPSRDRWRIRSRTFDGIAHAMADQWGGQTRGTDNV